MNVRYRASACFDMDSEIDVNDPNNTTEMLLQIVEDLQSRYRLVIEVETKESGVWKEL